MVGADQNIVDVESLDAEVAPSGEHEAAPEAEASASVEAAPEPLPEGRITDDDGFSWKNPYAEFEERLSSGLGGEIPDRPSEEVLGAINEKTLATLPKAARGFLRHVLASNKGRERAMGEALKKERAALRDARAKLDADHRQVLKNQAQLAEFFGQDKMKDMMAAADRSDAELPDPFSEAGIEARVERAAARRFREFSRPITQAAETARQQDRYQSFVDSHPEMRDAKFKSEMRQELQRRKDSAIKRARAANPGLDDVQLEAIGRGAVAGRLEDAYNAVKLSRTVAEQRSRLDRERRARANSMNRVTKNPKGGDPATSNVNEIVRRIRTEGYKGRYGAAATALYFKDNPKAMAARLASRRKR